MNQGDGHFNLRLARPTDVTELKALIDVSVRTLQSGDYSSSQIERALGVVFGVDSQLIADRSYYIVETAVDGYSVIVGSGGWSRRKTLFGSDHVSGREDAMLDPTRDSARIRAFFVHPSWARRGIGSMILEACEAAAIEAGFKSFELGATITGERLYRARGYSPMERIEVPLAEGISIPVIRMSKRVSR